MIHSHPKTQFPTTFVHLATFTFTFFLSQKKKKKKKKKTLKLAKGPPCHIGRVVKSYVLE
jgi:hypothetical protein